MTLPVDPHYPLGTKRSSPSSPAGSAPGRRVLPPPNGVCLLGTGGGYRARFPRVFPLPGGFYARPSPPVPTVPSEPRFKRPVRGCAADSAREAPSGARVTVFSAWRRQVGRVRVVAMVRLAFLTACLPLLLPGICLAAPQYAAPTGSGTACSAASPCDLVTAVNSASANDEV